ncbi:MAG: hypothetical protein J6B74_04275 [Ruminococcus sp.]|nr:hypothetical protein [Ruminococcus sp.]
MNSRIIVKCTQIFKSLSDILTFNGISPKCIVECVFTYNYTTLLSAVVLEHYIYFFCACTRNFL